MSSDCLQYSESRKTIKYYILHQYKSENNFAYLQMFFLFLFILYNIKYI